MVKLDDVYWRYEDVGSVYWGMKMYTVCEIQKSRNEPVIFIKSIDNKGKEYTKFLNANDEKFYPSEKVAWNDWKNRCSNYIKSHNKSIKHYETAIKEADARLELINNDR